ncbi:MAG: hypothetical protein JW955_22590, partial [Sedimentisphaerales bacterium]|nr:hypothetical protein [Sedimentisphaerales bacterium]
RNKANLPCQAAEGQGPAKRWMAGRAKQSQIWEDWDIWGKPHRTGSDSHRGAERAKQSQFARQATGGRDPRYEATDGPLYKQSQTWEVWGIWEDHIAPAAVRGIARLSAGSDLAAPAPPHG